MDAGSGTRARRAAGLAGVAVACLLASLVTTAGSLDAWFVGDDLGEIHRAEHGDTRGAHMRPLVTLGLRASHTLGGLDPWGYHLVNVVLHAVVIGAVGWAAAGLADRWGVVGGARTALPWTAGAVFAALATHAEAVSWISTRGDLWAAAAALVAVGAWARRDGRRRWTFVAAGALVVGLSAKEHATAIPVLCIVVGAGPGLPTWAGVRRAVREAVPLLGVLVAFVVLRALVLGHLVGSYEDGEGFTWSPVVVVGQMAAKAVRSVLPGTDTAGWAQVGAAAALGAVVVLARRDLRAALRSPAAGVAATGVVLALVALLPAAGLGVSLHDGRGERLVYMASTFAAIAVGSLAVALVDALPARAHRVAAAGLLGVALLVSARAAVERDGRWSEAGDLAEATLASGDRWDRPRQVVIVNPADTLRGAYAHRNTLGDAGVVAHGWPAPSLVAGLAPMEVDDPDAGATAEPIGERRWLLVPSEGARFLTGPDGQDSWNVEGVTARLRPDGSLEVEVSPGVPLEDVWLLEDGRLTDLAEAS